tara:strand:+ start:2049 stop:2372 length:324 start_codon:yes stop_codon:yes gene_type:complete
MKIELKREVQLLFNSKPVVFKKSELENIKKYTKKHIKNYQYKHLFNFVKYELIEDMIIDNEDNLNLEEFYITEYNTCIALISNLKSLLTKKQFKYIEDNLKINFYSI